MRRISVAALALVVALSFGGFLRAEGKGDARGVINKAIQAGGGEAKLAKFKSMTWKEKGTYYGQGTGQPYTGKYAVQFPGQFRMEIEGVFTIVLNGDKGWMKAGGETMDLTKEQLAEQQEGNYAGWVSTLLPLKDKAFTLTPLPETKVNDHAALGVKVSREGHRDISLFFDKGTGLLVKSQHKARSEEQGGKEVDQEAFYADYAEVEGAKIPRKITIKQDGKSFVEAENHDVKSAEKLDDKVFAKP
jgi:hypothetical protein